MKDTFKAQTFNANHFASGEFQGIGTAAPIGAEIVAFDVVIHRNIQFEVPVSRTVQFDVERQGGPVG